MSRSRKKVAIVKDSGKVIRYWRTVRRRINTVIHSNRNLDELERFAYWRCCQHEC